MASITIDTTLYHFNKPTKLEVLVGTTLVFTRTIQMGD